MEGSKYPADAQEKPASAYELDSMNVEQKTKDPPEKEYYVTTAKEAEKKVREEENKNSEEATAYGRCVLLKNWVAVIKSINKSLVALLFYRGPNLSIYHFLSALLDMY